MSIEERCPGAYSKIEKYVNTEDLGLPASLARFPKTLMCIGNYRLYYNNPSCY